MESARQLLLYGLALQGVVAAANAAATYFMARGRGFQFERTLAGAWLALAVYYGTFAGGYWSDQDSATGFTFVGAIPSFFYLLFVVLLADASQVLWTGNRFSPTTRWRLIAGSAVFALATSAWFVTLEYQTPLRFFARVGLRSLVIGVLVLVGAAMLWQRKDSISLPSRRLFGLALGLWALTQLYHGVTSLSGALGWPIDNATLRVYLTLAGGFGLAAGGLAVLGWMLEFERRQVSEQETRERALFERSAAPMAFVSTDLRWLKVNQAFCQLVGYPPAALVGRSVMEITHPEDIESTRRYAGSFEAPTRPGVAFAKRYIRPSGEVVWARLVPALVRDAEGRPDYFITVYEDLTERRQAEEALQVSERRSRILIEQSSDLVSVLSPDGTVLFSSPSSERIMGYPPARRVGHRVDEVIHPEDGARVLEVLRRVAAAPQGTVELVAYRARHADDSWRQLESAVTNLTEDPTVRGLVTNTRDITERVRLEEQFRQAQKMEGVGRLAGGIAHDFNNLLTIILGNASLLEKDLPEASPWKEDLVMIRETAERGAGLTRQLLAFARRQVVEPKVLDPNGFVRALVTLLERLAGPTITVTTDLMADTRSVLVDPGQLQQVLVNLVVNAKDAMPDGGRLTLRTRRQWLSPEEAQGLGLVVSGEFSLLEVEDTGPGLSAEARQFLFEPFFTTKGAEKGTGLGLATCYGIVRQAGGTIVAVEDHPGGALFRVYLPSVPEAGVEPPAGEVEVEESAAGSETVLVVDDEPAVRALVTRTLRQRGYQVMEAADGVEAEAMSLGHAGTIHALVTDVVMPRMGGLELATRLRQARQDIEVLFTSGFADGFAFRDQAALQGAAFLEKPYRPRVLASRLRELLDRNRA